MAKPSRDEGQNRLYFSLISKLILKVTKTPGEVFDRLFDKKNDTFPRIELILPTPDITDGNSSPPVMTGLSTDYFAKNGQVSLSDWRLESVENPRGGFRHFFWPLNISPDSFLSKHPSVLTGSVLG